MRVRGNGKGYGMRVRFMTVKGSDRLGARAPFYIGFPQHGRIMSKKEAYAYCAAKTGYTQTAVRAVFQAMARYVRENAAKGNITHIDGIASVRNYVKGAFDDLKGPWTKGRNLLMVKAVELEPFRTALDGVTPENTTEGAKPVIDTVFDEVTRTYGTITGTDLFSIAGADLGPDAERADEYVAFADARDVETRCEIEHSDLQNVKAHLAAALPAGTYTLKVYTRSGMGEAFGVKCATRKVTVA